LACREFRRKSFDEKAGACVDDNTQDSLDVRDDFGVSFFETNKGVCERLTSP